MLAKNLLTNVSLFTRLIVAALFMMVASAPITLASQPSTMSPQQGALNQKGHIPTHPSTMPPQQGTLNQKSHTLPTHPSTIPPQQGALNQKGHALAGCADGCDQKTCFKNYNCHKCCQINGGAELTRCKEKCVARKKGVEPVGKDLNEHKKTEVGQSHAKG